MLRVLCECSGRDEELMENTAAGNSCDLYVFFQGLLADQFSRGNIEHMCFLRDQIGIAVAPSVRDYFAHIHPNGIRIG